MFLRYGKYGKVLFGVRSETTGGQLEMLLRYGKYRKVLLGVRSKTAVTNIVVY